MISLFMGLNAVKSHHVDGFRSNHQKCFAFLWFQKTLFFENLFKGLMGMNPMLRKFMGGGAVF
jgi:hypothetical protein